MQKLPRPTTDEDRAELKSATRASLRALKASSFAMVTRVDEPALSKYGSLAEAAHFMPVDVLADLQKEYGHGVASPLLEALAAQAGFRLVPVVADDDSGGGIEIEHISAAHKEVGEGMAASLRAVGSTDLTLVREARREVAESYAAIAAKKIALARQERNILRRRA